MSTTVKLATAITIAPSAMIPSTRNECISYPHGHRTKRRARGRRPSGRDARVDRPADAPLDSPAVDVTLTVVLVVALALLFDFTNGFHDTANAMATPIATGALRPRTAVAIAAVLNLVGAFLSTDVAKTISGGLIREGDDGVQITPTLILAGLIGAIVWNLVTWLLGLPSSSSHALFGGLIGAAVVGAWSFDPIDGAVVVSKILIPALLAPLLAGTV